MPLKTKHLRLAKLQAIRRVQADHAKLEAAAAANAEFEQEHRLGDAREKADGALADWERLQRAGRLDPQFAQAFAALLYRSENDVATEREALQRAQTHTADKRLLQSGAQAQAAAASERAKAARSLYIRRREDERLDALQILRGSRRRP